VHIRSLAFSDAETWKLRKSDQKYLESFMWRWRRLEEISWTERVRSKEVLQKDKERRDILHTVIGRKAKWIGHVLRWNCLLNTLLKER